MVAWKTRLPVPSSILSRPPGGRRIVKPGDAGDRVAPAADRCEGENRRGVGRRAVISIGLAGTACGMELLPLRGSNHETNSHFCCRVRGALRLGDSGGAAYVPGALRPGIAVHVSAV